MTTSINTGTFGGNGEKAINHFNELARLFSQIPEQIQEANNRASITAKQEIEENIKKRGRPGNLFDVNVRQNGPVGLRVSIEQKHVDKQRPYHGAYNSDIAAKIFFNSEMGMVGRKPFVLNMEDEENGNSPFYKVSHTSGRFNEGDEFGGYDILVPGIGPFYFSRKTSMKNETLKEMAFKRIKDQLNLRYKHIIRMNKRILNLRAGSEDMFK